ncbi:MAG: hypothetical protein ACREFI_13265 [Stellaceae bacterium]
MNDLRERARALGLDKLTAEHLAQLERATATMKRHIERLPRDLTVTDEPAHIYQAKERRS